MEKKTVLIIAAVLGGGYLLFRNSKALAAGAYSAPTAANAKSLALNLLSPLNPTPNNQPVTTKPILPPGTAPAVVAAVETAFNNGTLTQGQSDAVSQLYAPLYNPQVIIPIDNSAQALADAQAAQAQLNLTGTEILAGQGNQGTTAGPSNSVVDFGSNQAAQDALAAYAAQLFADTGIKI